MRRILIATALGALVAVPAAEAYWHAGGVTRWGTAWHAGGTGTGYRWGTAYHPGYGGATYVHGYSGYHYGGYYRAPVPVAPVPYYHPYHPVGAFAAGAVTGAAVGAASATAAANSVYHYGQPTTVVNNYYN
ncbi:hypothetical protein DFH01_14345 [Falsiroseomonas bella]|uniref:Sulfur globule protein n=1 Tax=Falsiroseomonas bella TaxID=2184016 RepID=A0A317FB46_9PROT|nr:hypothetical protein [Falsiroseomonas bella]PWS36351.1 hypothetical protein DFH01_14345 [Falsiroseomonas bella]